ncbi:hypothetical protein CPR19088_GLDEOEPO_01809 [Companilactobacillus paralimentarius]
MKNSEQVSLMMDQLSKAYGDTEVKRHPDLAKMILDSAQELEKNHNPELVSSRLCKKITVSYLANSKDFPKAIIVLFNQLKGKEMKYDGVALATMMLPIWF